MGMRIFITTQFEALHQWDNAPTGVEFLRHPHRHVFHLRVEWLVTHDDREKEFILLKRKTEKEIRRLAAHADTSRWSCERWGKELLTILDAVKVEVSEDGENGAIIER